MRSADQVKRKRNELASQKAMLEGRLADTDDPVVQAALRAQLERVQDMMLLLEWVLEAPEGAYHA